MATLPSLPATIHDRTSSAALMMSTTGRAHIVVLVLVTGVLIAFVEHVAAGQVSLDADVRSAVAVFDSYNQALTDKDYSKLRGQLIHVPFVVVDGTPRVIESVDAVVAGLQKTRASLDAAGYATTRSSAPRISVLSPDRLLLNYRLAHVNRDGTVLAERANFYLMVKVAGIWKVGGIIPQDPERFDPQH